jgi:hypothetical protein
VTSAGAERDAFIQEHLPELIEEVVQRPEIVAGLKRSTLTPADLRDMLLATGNVLVQPADHLVAAAAHYGFPELPPWSRAVLLIGRVAAFAGVISAIAITFSDSFVDGDFRGVRVPWSLLLGCAVVLAVLVMLARRPARTFVESPLTRWRQMCVEDGVLPCARRIINEHLTPSAHMSLLVAPGFVSEREASYPVRTESVMAFQRALRRLPTGSIGIAGPRGAGKTTLITSFAADDHAHPRPLRVHVSAPVQYEPKDFVRHLFAAVCRAVLQDRELEWERARQHRHAVHWRVRLVAVPAAAVLAALPVTGFSLFDHWEPLLIPAALLAATFLVDLFAGLWWTAGRRLWLRLTRGPTIADIARKHLDDIHHLRTQTSGWSGKVPLPLRSEAGWSRSVHRERRAHTYPELVTALCDFLAAYAAEKAHTPATIIAVDELDKIDSPERAQQFINEIKSVFNTPGTQFLVSVSDDALAAFERRGLPVRDAFDSAFDEIVRVGHLSLAETRELIKGRVIGLPDPFTWLTHCMTGGLPREVKRTARAMIALPGLGSEPMSLDDVCAALVGDDLARKAHAFQLACREAGDGPEVTTFIRHLRMLRPDKQLLLSVLKKLRVDGELAALSRQAAAYVYYSATLLEVFRGDRVEKRRTETFEKLAQAKQSLAVHPRLAWLLVDEFRAAWRLKTVSAD